VGLSRTAWYQTPLDWRERNAEVIDALNALVEAHPRWGFWKYPDRLRAQGYSWNHKRIYRVYCTLGLNQPCRTKQWLPERVREPLFVPERPVQAWSADFMSDTLHHGTRFRTFNIIDDYIREGLAIEIDTSLRALRVVRVPERVKGQDRLPDVLRVDNGSEFLSDWSREKEFCSNALSQASRTRMPISSDSTALTEMRYWVYIFSAAWTRWGNSQLLGDGV